MPAHHGQLTKCFEQAAKLYREGLLLLNAKGAALCAARMGCSIPGEPRPQPRSRIQGFPNNTTIEKTHCIIGYSLRNHVGLVQGR